MKSWKVIKFHIMESVSTICIYYAIFIAVIIILIFLNADSGKISSSGLEMASVIFLFIAGLNSFKTNFKFSQANQTSRKTFFKGIIIAVFPITFAMSLLDIIINRVYNIFIPSPTNFDMIYGSLRDAGIRNSSGFAWTQANDFYTLFGTIIWQFVVYSFAFFLGLLITLVYYRSSKPVKVVVSIAPVVLLVLLLNVLPESFRNTVGVFVSSAFGWQTRNPYMAVFNFGVLGVILTGFIYLLMRRAVARE
jgi:hypothetical protein